MRLHLDSVVGDNYIYPIYDIDFETLKLISGYSVSIAPTTAHGYTYNKWSVSNQTGIISRGLPPTVPRKPEQEGNILPTRYSYNLVKDGVTYLENWFTDGYYRLLTEQPTDWGQTCKYVKIWNPGQGSYRHCWAQPAYSTNTFEANNTYEDLHRLHSRIFYTERGGSFGVVKTGEYIAAATINYCCWACGYPPDQPSRVTADEKKAYCFTSDKDDQIISEDLRIRRTTSQNIGGGYYNSVWIFVHYTNAGVEYYGIAEIFYNNFSDNPVPTGLSVVGIDKSYWDENIIPGGVPGEGSWGGKTHTGGGAGDWTFSSDSRGNGSAATGQAIATEAASCLSAFFSGSNGFKLHQILPADVPDIYGALYSTSFMDRYVHAMYNPLSAVISMHMLPEKLLDMAHATTSSPLTLSGFSVTSEVTHKNYPEIPTVYSHHIQKYLPDYTDTFIDFAPYTQVYLHLPYIGVIQIDTNAIAQGEIAIDYITDATTGNCAALVWCKDRDNHDAIKYVAQGNAAYTMPMFSVNQDGSAVGKIFNSGLGVAMAALTGNMAGAAASASGIASGIFDAATAQQSTQLTGSFGGNVGMVSDSVCWLEIVRPCWCEPEHFQALNGIPSQLSGTIADYGDGVPYVGYLVVSSVEMEGLTATDDEKKEIEQLLKAGIFVNTQAQ